jgi:Na+/H+-dicarboxylate symporter
LGRYTVVPVLIFSLTIAVYELRLDKQFWKLVSNTLIVIVASAIFIITVGVIVTLIFPPARIPILIQEQVQPADLGAGEAILGLFPPNMLSALVSNGVYLLPVYIFAFFLGLGLSYDHNYSRNIISLIDTLAHVFYHIATFFSEVLGVMMIALAAWWAMQFHGALKAEVYRDLLILLGVLSVVLAFGVLPLFLYLLPGPGGRRCNPWQVLYGSLGQAFAAFFSGDVNFSIPVMMRHLKENCGVRRRSEAVTISMMTSFCRAGSAMVAAAAFIVIIKSYSSLGISVGDVLNICLRAFGISFLLARHPGDGAYTALAVLSAGYGRGFEAGYLILKPIAFYLVACGTFIDVMLTTFGSFALARVFGFQEQRSREHYI